MNRTNFRHRTLDQTKPLPIIHDITEIVKKEDPQISNSLDHGLITPAMYATSWVLTIFAKYSI